MFAFLVRNTEFTELSVRVLYSELKTVTNPIKLGLGLGIKQHHLEIIRRNNVQGVCCSLIRGA